jgi:serine/threonine protein phosphatase 1
MRHFFDRLQQKKPLPRTPRGICAYAVGDVHGRLDLLNDLLVKIEADVDRRAPRRGLLIFLGDVIDRGPSSCQTIERLRNYHHPILRTIFLLGNHEEVLLRLLAGERGIFCNWLRFGGSECLLSYGMDPKPLKRIPEREALSVIKRAIPEAHQRFLASFADTVRFGSYLFVHAGVRPLIDLSMQSQSDLRWIREPFLSDESDHGFVVVHGHTISHKVVERSNRIGIDTGAYRTGVLSALAVEGSKRWTLDTSATGVGNDDHLIDEGHIGDLVEPRP